MTRPMCMAGIALLLGCGGCAFLNRDNTPTLNWVEKRLVPENPTRRTLTLPVTVPVGLVAVAADAMAVHPAYQLDDALADTTRALWHRDTFDWDRQYVTEHALLLPRAVASPGVFGWSFVTRGYFDVEPR